MIKGDCGFCLGIKMLILGILLLLNYFWIRFDWGLFIGILLVVFGIVKLFTKKSCSCGSEEKDIKEKPKRRR